MSVEDTPATDNPEPILAELVQAGGPRPTAPSASKATNDADQIEDRRKVLWPLVLFIATCASMFCAQAGEVMKTRAPNQVRILNKNIMVYWDGTVYRINWVNALTYTAAGMAVLLSHEMGHFLQAARYRVPASWPLFLPMPISPIGTMGAVILMRGSVADRKQMFDIGITGPLAGLLVALPICWIGVRDAVPSTAAIEQARQGFAFNNPLLIQLMVRYHHPELPADTILNVSTNPLYLAGWMAMLITGLNMVPVSQLDGGHVSYALFGKKAHWLARGLLVLALTGIMITRQYFFIVMILLIVFVIGPDHPPTANDQAPMGRGRKILGYLSLAIPIFCLAPVPILLPG